MWTQFWDMHSGGGTKEPPYEKIYIEAPEDEAVSIFYSRFGHNPHKVTCTCCGPDYSISEYEELAQATAFHRNCEFDEKLNKYIEQPKKYAWDGTYAQHITLEDYCNQEDVCIIRKETIKDNERDAYVPEEGYVWID